ncbi:MAG: glycosyltransferase family 39 protein [Solirubrobacterales bacterium]
MRVSERLRGLRPTEPAHWVLAGMVAAGVLVRCFAAVSWWPAGTTLPDSILYASYAEDNPLDSAQHPAGYSAALALLGVVSREVAVPVLLQHLSGIASALLLYAAVRRLTGSPWPALAPAAVVLLNADLVFLEHTVMSESLFLLVLSAALYAAVRSIDAPEPSWRWALACGALVALAAVIRSAGLFALPVVVLAVLLCRPGPWRSNWRPPAAIAGAAAVLLLGYATASSAVNGRFELAPAQGWHLYGRVAPFADCARFEPPEDTESLCESTPPEKRPGLDYYIFDGTAPAFREFGALGEQDGKLGSFARAAILNQPGDYLSAVWDDISGFYVPGGYPFRRGAGSDLDPQLDWRWPLLPVAVEVPTTEREIELGMEGFFNPFSVDPDPGGLEQLRDYQTVFRFGATALAITTALSLLGLLIGPRRNRVAVLLFGVGGLAILLLPALSVQYAARYMVPVAPLLAAGAAISVLSAWRRGDGGRRRLGTIAP